MGTPWGLSERDFRTVVGCIVCGFLITFIIVTISSNIGTIQKEFGADYAVASSFTQILAMSYIVFFLLSIAITDRYGKRTSILTGLVTLIVSSMLCAISKEMCQLIIFVTIMGFGFALIQASCLSIVTDIVDNEFLGEAMSFNYAASSTGAVVSPLISIYLAERFGIGIMFLMAAIIALITIILVKDMDNVKTRPDSKIDWTMNGIYLVSTLLIIGTLMFPLAGNRDLILAAGVVLLIVFIALNIRNRTLGGLGILKNKVFVMSLALAFIVVFCSKGIENSMNQMLLLKGSEIVAFGTVVSMTLFASFLMSFKPLIQAILSPMIGRYCRNKDTNAVMTVGIVLLLISSIFAVATTKMDVPEALLIMMVMVYLLHALTSSVFMPNNKKMMMESVKEEERNVASSVSSVVGTVASISGVMILVNLIDSCKTMDAFRDASIALFAIVLAVSVIGLGIAVWRMRSVRTRDCQKR